VDNRNLVIWGCLILLAAGSLWLTQRTQPGRQSTQALEHIPDYYLEGYTATVLDEEGKPSQRLVAEKLTHYPDDDSTELKQPRLTIFDEGRPPWRIRSETGWVSGDGEVILLQGKVNIDRSEVPGVRGMHIATRDLRVQSKDNYVESEAVITVRSGRDRLSAKGIQAWFSKPVRIKLLANVRGHHEVN
jgi:lipopolysaccharide export system protein LptC